MLKEKGDNWIMENETTSPGRTLPACSPVTWDRTRLACPPLWRPPWERTLLACSPPTWDRTRLACPPLWRPPWEGRPPACSSAPWDRTRLACPSPWPPPRDRTLPACPFLRAVRPETKTWDRMLPVCFPRRQRNPREWTRSASPPVRRHHHFVTRPIIVASVLLLRSYRTAARAAMPGLSRLGLYSMPRHSRVTTARLIIGCISAVETPSFSTMRSALFRRCITARARQPPTSQTASSQLAPNGPPKRANTPLKNPSISAVTAVEYGPRMVVQKAS